jgi:hypothetical protein
VSNRDQSFNYQTSEPLSSQFDSHPERLLLMYITPNIDQGSISRSALALHQFQFLQKHALALPKMWLSSQFAAETTNNQEIVLHNCCCQNLQQRFVGSQCCSAARHVTE